jgi:hypothetical protein
MYLGNQRGRALRIGIEKEIASIWDKTMAGAMPQR